MTLKDGAVPAALRPFASEWILSQTEGCDGRELFCVGWRAVRCRDLTPAERATARISRTVMRGSPDDLAEALREQQRQTSLLANSGSTTWSL